MGTVSFASQAEQFALSLAFKYVGLIETATRRISQPRRNANHFARAEIEQIEIETRRIPPSAFRIFFQHLAKSIVAKVIAGERRFSAGLSDTSS
jgi:hypothetical protein